MEDAAAASRRILVLHISIAPLWLGLVDLVLGCCRLLLGLRVLLVRAEQLDLSSLQLRGHRLGVGLEQVQRLAVLLCVKQDNVRTADVFKVIL